MGVLDSLLALAVFCFAAAALWAYHLVTRRRLVGHRLDPPTEKTRKKGELPEWVGRLIRQAAPTGERYTSPGQRAKIERLLHLAGHPLDLDLVGFLGLRLLFVFAGMGLGVPLTFFFGIRPLLVLMAVGYFAPVWWLKGRSGDRQAEIAASLPDFMDTLAVSLRAGVGLYPALKKVSARFGGPLGAEFTRIVEQIDMGVPIAEALRGIMQRTTCRELELFIDSLTQALDLGVPVAMTLAAQANSVRTGRVQRAKEKAAKASPKITLLATFFVTPGVFMLLIGMVLLNMYYHPERYGIDFLFH